MRSDVPNPPASGLLVQRLRAEHADDLERFCRRCEAFFELVTGERDAAVTATSLWTSCPPGVALEHKFLFGILRGTDLVAVVDLLEGFPSESEWYVGLLLLLPEERNRQTGRAIWHAMEDWLRSRGGRSARLLVQDQNARAAHFWRSLGFLDEVRVQQTLAGRNNECWQFVKRYDTPA